MKLQSLILASAVVLLGAYPAYSQQQTLTENVNNTGIPRNAPSLGLSNIYGLNPCSSGTSVGVTTPLFGVGGAVSSIDKECETRNNAAVVVTGLKDETLAREILCEIKDIRAAAMRVGRPCLQDQASPRVASAEPVKAVLASSAVAAVEEPTRPAPTEVAVVPVSKPTRTAIRQDAPAFCHVNGLDLALYPDCSEGPAPTSTVGPSGPIKSTAKMIQVRPVNRPSVPSADGAASVAPQKRIARLQPEARCGQGAVAQADRHCQIALAAMIALEQNFRKLINLREQQLARANTGDTATTQSQNEPGDQDTGPSIARKRLLASVAPAE